MARRTTLTCAQNLALVSLSRAFLYRAHMRLQRQSKKKKSIEELVSSFYTVVTLASAYADNILPISNNVNSSEVKINGEGEKVAIFPPASKRPPGRPRKTRILSTGEIRVSTFELIRMKTPRRRRHVCSRCKGRGHNKATCKVAI
ncbi:unnamed protein product [Brassica rapa subsp. trilocularis]